MSDEEVEIGKILTLFWVKQRRFKGLTAGETGMKMGISPSNCHIMTSWKFPEY